MSFTFLQYDKRWASKLYPKGNKKKSTMKTSGCYNCAMADIEYNHNPKILPTDIADYSSSIGGATQGGATYHSTVFKGGKHYGWNVIECAKMSDFLNRMKKGDCWGMLIFRSGTKGGIKWTSGGHYLTVTSFRKADELYCRDSGLRKHIGWYSYTKHMQGLIKNAYIFYDAKETPTELPTEMPTKTPNEKAIDGAVAFGKSIANSNIYGYKKYDSTDHACPICHTKTKVKGFNCIGFVASCFAHGAGDKKILANCKANNGSALGNNVTLTSVTEESWKKKCGNDWKMITNGGAKNGKDIPTSSLKKGDILIGYDSKGKYKHTMLYIGSGKLLDAVSSGSKANQIAERSYSTRCNAMCITRAFRYTGKGKF